MAYSQEAILESLSFHLAAYMMQGERYSYTFSEISPSITVEFHMLHSKSDKYYFSKLSSAALQQSHFSHGMLVSQAYS